MLVREDFEIISGNIEKCRLIYEEPIWDKRTSRGIRCRTLVLKIRLIVGGRIWLRLKS